jgi:hypothetical protein
VLRPAGKQLATARGRVPVTMNGAARRARQLSKRSRQNSVFRRAFLRRPSISALKVLAGAQREQWCAVVGVPKACATGLKHASPCATARRRATARAVLQPAPSTLILRVASWTRAWIPSSGVSACRAGARAEPRRSWSRARGAVASCLPAGLSAQILKSAQHSPELQLSIEKCTSLFQ